MFHCVIRLYISEFPTLDKNSFFTGIAFFYCYKVKGLLLQIHSIDIVEGNDLKPRNDAVKLAT